MTTIVPDLTQRQLARRIARLSKQEGAEAVLEAVEDLHYDDLPLVVVALARMAWNANEPAESPGRGPLPGIPADARAAHALFERFRKLGGEIPMQVREGEQWYQAERHLARKRKRGAA